MINLNMQILEKKYIEKLNVQSSPVGPLAPVRRACLPSVPSSVCARNVQIAASSQRLDGSAALGGECAEFLSKS